MTHSDTATPVKQNTASSSFRLLQCSSHTLKMPNDKLQHCDDYLFALVCGLVWNFLWMKAGILVSVSTSHWKYLLYPPPHVKDQRETLTSVHLYLSFSFFHLSLTILLSLNGLYQNRSFLLMFVDDRSPAVFIRIKTSALLLGWRKKNQLASWCEHISTANLQHHWVVADSNIQLSINDLSDKLMRPKFGSMGLAQIFHLGCFMYELVELILAQSEWVDISASVEQLSCLA